MRRLFLEHFGQAHPRTPLICLVYELCSDAVFELPSDWICTWPRFGRCTVYNYPVFDLSGDPISPVLELSIVQNCPAFKLKLVLRKFIRSVTILFYTVYMYIFV